MPINTPTGYLDITNATLRGSKIVTTGYVGIANANPTNHLSIGSNLHINDTHSNVLQVSGNINAASVVLGGLSIAPTFDLEIVTNTGNTTPYTVEFNNTATAFVTTANATIGDTLTASKLVGDGSGISSIQSSNVTDFASNVSRITALESSRALKTDLDNNSARITNLSSNLSDNSSRITTLESGDISISGDKTFTGEIIFESNVHMNGGNVLVANTVNMTVSDPIIELGSNNLNTNDLGIIMTRHGATNSNIALVYDESDDILRMGYTLNGASDSIISLDSNALSVSVQGALSAASVTTDDYLIHGGDTDTKVGFPTADTFTVTTANSERLRVDSSGNVGVGTASPEATFSVLGNNAISGSPANAIASFRAASSVGVNDAGVVIGSVNGNAPYISDVSSASLGLGFYTQNVNRLQIDSSGRVGIGTTSPQYKLTVVGDVNVRSSLSTGRNLARELGTVIAYSSQYSSDRSAANIINGAKNFENGSNDWITANGQRTNAYVVIDLGAAYTIDRMVVYNQNEYADSSREVKGFTLTASSDNSTWVTILTSECGRSNAHEPNPGWNFRIPSNWDDDSEGNTYRYWKFTMNTFHGTNGYGGITELELYASNEAIQGEVSSSSIVAQDVYTETGNFSRGLTVGKGYGGTSTGDSNAIIEGNVGIGTTGPIRVLDSRSGDGSSSAGWISGAFGPATGLSTNPRVVVGTYSNVSIVGSHRGDLNTWSDLYLNNPSNPVVVKASGSVGIGTSAPAHILHVEGSSPGSPICYIK